MHKLNVLQCETVHLGQKLGQKLSKLSLKDHCSRDPVQVQSGQERLALTVPVLTSISMDATR